MTNPKRVMILGASRYQARAVIAAREMGCEVLATDRNPDAYAFAYADYAEPVDISDIEASIATARRYKVDGVVPLNDFGLEYSSRSRANQPGIRQSMIGFLLDYAFDAIRKKPITIRLRPDYA